MLDLRKHKIQKCLGKDRHCGSCCGRIHNVVDVILFQNERSPELSFRWRRCVFLWLFSACRQCMSQGAEAAGPGVVVEAHTNLVSSDTDHGLKQRLQHEKNTVEPLIANVLFHVLNKKIPHR